MRVGIYNRWLAPLGGGEKHSLSIAEYLSQNHQVSVLSHTPVSKERAESKLNLDLSRIEFLAIPERLAIEITPITQEYDFFLTTSFMDYFPSRANKSATLIFFPTPVDAEPIMHLRRRLKLDIRRFLKVPSFTQGVINLQVKGNSQRRWVDTLTTVHLPTSQRPYRCQFEIASLDDGVTKAAIHLNGEEHTTINLFDNQEFKQYKLAVPAGKSLHCLEIKALGHKNLRESSGKEKLLIENFNISLPNYRIYQLVFECWLKNWGLRMHYIPPGIFSILESLDTYDGIWANSEYTQKWIRKYWDRSSEVLYPPIDVEAFAPGDKKNQIISVGRYFSGSHNKKHMVMIRAFKEMVDSGLSGWKLILVGSTTPGLVHEEYLYRLEKEAQGYPISILKDIPFIELVGLYGESSIYWHASGYGEDEEREPIKFEHFGITTVEGMASGCVPVVIGSGGQPEIIRHGKNGFLWYSMDELKAFTIFLIQNDKTRKQLAKEAQSNSRNFNRANFETNLQKLLSKIGID